MRKHITGENTFKVPTLIKIKFIAVVFILFASLNVYSQSELDEGYYQLNQGNYEAAAGIFENYLLSNPDDTKIYLQLAYLYKSQGNSERAIEYFTHVKNYSYNSDEVSSASSELEYLQKDVTLEKLNDAYSLLDRGNVDEAIVLFKEHLDQNPNDSKVSLQLGYLYSNRQQYDSAIVYFEKTKNRSTVIEDVRVATKEIENINSIRTLSGSPSSPKLDSAYSLLKAGKEYDAIRLFEEYSYSNPGDTKVQLQLGYLYSERKNISKAKQYFESVKKNTTSSDEREKATTSLNYLNDYRGKVSPSSVDIYFHNFYDANQENYISNFIGKYQYSLFRNFNTGIYGDVYLDSRSRPGLIYNDRYAEVGGFFRYNFFPSLSLELRAGYVRLIDREESKFNFKPILSFSDKFGHFPVYKKSGVKSQNFYLDTYAAALYDHKYENFFGQAQLREVLRYMTGGYSFFEVYLKQNIQGDSKQIDYNNYGELGGGIAYTPNIKSFPTLFAEAVNRFYFVRSNTGLFPESAFQFRLGFILTYNSPL